MTGVVNRKSKWSRQVFTKGFPVRVNYTERPSNDLTNGVKQQ
jgi:hypothetical protein